MVSKIRIFEGDGLEKLLDGVEYLAGIASRCLGTHGKNILVSQAGKSAHLSKNFSEILSSINFSNAYAQTAVDLLRETFKDRPELSGTEAYITLMVHELFSKAIRSLHEGADLYALRASLSAAMQEAALILDSMRLQIADRNAIYQLTHAYMPEDTRASKRIADSLEEVGKTGALLVQRESERAIQSQEGRGIILEVGYVSPYFITEPEGELALLPHPKFFITDKCLQTSQQASTILSEHFSHSCEPLVVIAPMVTDDALDTFIVNKVKAEKDICIIRPPFTGQEQLQWLDEIAKLLGADIINLETMEEAVFFPLNSLGSADGIEIYRNTTTIYGPHGKKECMVDIAKDIEEEIEKSGSFDTKCDLQLKLARYLQNLKFLYLPDEAYEARADRYREVILKTKLSLQGGVVLGDGNSFVRVSERLTAQVDNEGARIVKEALKAPLMHLAKQAGLVGEVVVNNILSQGETVGFDAHHGSYSDLYQNKIFEPADSIKYCLDVSLSLTNLLLSLSNLTP